MSSQYDVAGRRTQLTGPGGYFLSFAHRVTGELAAVNDGYGNAVTLGHDDLGRRTSLTRGNGTSTSYAYDAAGRLASMGQDLAGTAHDLTLTFGYNPAGQIVSNTRSNDAYSYDALANQNRTDSHNGLNQVTASASTAVTHDARGNTSAIGGSSYGYDSQNRMTSGPGASLAYDPLGRLVQVSGGAGTRRFLYDGAHIISTADGAGNIQEAQAHGAGIDEPVAAYTAAGRRFLHADERGSVVAQSDGSGAATAVNRYDEYG